MAGKGTRQNILLGLLHAQRLGAQAVGVAEEENALASALGLLAGLDPLAHASASPHGADEAPGAVLGVGPVVLAHDGADGVRCLVSVVEGNGADVVVQDVRLDDAVEQVAADEAHLAIDGGSGTADKVPLVGRVVRQRRVSVLEEGDGDCGKTVSISAKTRESTLDGITGETNRASG